MLGNTRSLSVWKKSISFSIIDGVFPKVMVIWIWRGLENFGLNVSAEAGCNSSAVGPLPLMAASVECLRWRWARCWRARSFKESVGGCCRLLLHHSPQRRQQQRRRRLRLVPHLRRCRWFLQWEDHRESEENLARIFWYVNTSPITLNWSDPKVGEFNILSF